MTQSANTNKVATGRMLGVRLCVAGMFGAGFFIASLISWGQKPDTDPNHEPISAIGPVIDCLGGLIVGAIYFCTSSTAHWFMRKKNPMPIIISDVALFLIGLVYLWLQGFSH